MAVAIEKKSRKSATPTVVEASTAVAGTCNSCPLSNHLLRKNALKAAQRQHSYVASFYAQKKLVKKRYVHAIMNKHGAF